MKTIPALLILLLASCASDRGLSPTYYTADGDLSCTLHKEKLVGLKLPLRYGYRFGVSPPLKKENHPNYMPWVNGGDLRSEEEEKEAIVPVCLSCKSRYEALHPSKEEPNQPSEPAAPGSRG